MKHTIAIFLCFQLMQIANSQEVLVPFRVGNKFGLSTVAGKMVLSPKYDKINIDGNYPNAYFGFQQGNTKGLIFNQKEIINDSNYTKLAIFDNKFIIGEFGRGYGTKGNSLFTKDGKNLYPENFHYLRALDSMGISKKDPHCAKYALFFCEQINGRKGIFIYDIDKQSIAKWLLKDYLKINVEKEFKGDYQGITIETYDKPRKLIVKAKKEIDSEDERLSFELENNEVLMKPAPIAQTPNYKKENGDGVGMGTNSMAEDRYEGVVEAPQMEKSIEMPGSKPRKRPIYITTKFIKRNDSLLFEHREAYGKPETVNITLPFKYDSLKIEVCSNRFTNTDSSADIYIGNVVHFISNGKHGLLLQDTMLIQPRYDELSAYMLSGRTSNTLFFLVGLKNAQTQAMQYGTIDIYGKSIVPLIYDSLDAGISTFASSKRLFVNYCNNTWKVTKNKQKGLISPEGKIVLPIIYDGLYYKSIGYNYYEKGRDNFWTLQKNNLFGLFATDIDNGWLIEPKFDKQIGYYIPNFRGQKGLTILGLIDKNNLPFCYARKDGFLYYKP